MSGGAREDLVLRGLEAPPHRFALRPWRERDLLPASLQLAIASLERELLRGGKRFDLPRGLLKPFQIVLLEPRTQLLMLVLFLLERRNRLLQPRAGAGIRGGVIAKHVRIAPQAAPSRDD